jgi:porin
MIFDTLAILAKVTRGAMRTMIFLFGPCRSSRRSVSLPSVFFLAVACLSAARPVCGQELYQKGVLASAVYTGEAAANPVGGIRQGQDYAGEMEIGADFDLAELAGWQGSAVHFVMTDRHGRNLSADFIGNNTKVQEIYGTVGIQNVHLAVLTFEQKLFEGRLDLTAGRTEASNTFLFTPLFCNFQNNSVCGNPTFIFKDSNFTYYPASAWGGEAKGFVTEHAFLHAGAYEVNPADKRSTTHGFNWGVGQATGVTLPFEIGYASSFADDPLPRHYQLGGWYDSSIYADPLLDRNGGLWVLSDQRPATDSGRSGAYFSFDQMIWRPDPESQRGLTLIGVAMTSLGGRVIEDRFYEIALLQTGTFPGRDLDTLGFAITDQQFSGLALARIAAARAAVGGGGGMARHEIMMELAYGAQIAPAIRLSPNLQFIVSPDQLAEPFRTRAIPNAFVVGFKFILDAAQIAGLAPPPR